MFKNLKIGTQIALGFGSVIVLFTVVSAIAFLGLNNTYQGFVDYRGLALDNHFSSQIEANLLSIQLNAKEFLVSSKDQDVQEYKRHLEQIHGFLEQAKRLVQQPERAALVQKVDQEMARYQTAFTEVVQLVHRRQQILSGQLEPNGLAMRKAITEIIQSAYADQDLEATYYTSRAQEQLLLGRLYVLKYLNSHHHEDLDRALLEMEANVNKTKQEMDAALQNPQRRALFAQFDQAHTTYVAIMKDLFQVTEQCNSLIENVL
ncbi:MAG: Tar ligand binding domain-containing protein, partial [Candidatus Competibacteraceae bacterium]|nr:Tar ligand binding domain-containing protein [Candidatus Competibacteraceae bacterium]